MAETPIRAAEREPQIIAARTGRLEQVIREEIVPELLAETPFKAHIFEMMLDMALSLGPDDFLRQSRALQKRRDYQRSLSLIKCPCLVLCGAKDQVTTVQRQEFIAELTDPAKLVVIENVGHVPTLEQPEATIAALRDWLN
jgi:pimeloyl-ACP methyl ester carboxylesterase